MAEISAGWISISVTSHGRTNAGQLRAYGRIDHARSHFDDETAEQAGIDLCLKARITAELGLQGGLELGRLGIRKRARGDHGRLNLAAQPRDQAFEGTNDVKQGKKPALRRQCQNK